jgi:phage tail-like protein
VAVVLTSGVVEVFQIGSGLLVARAVVPGAASVAIGTDGSLEVVDRHGLRTELDPSGLVCRAERCRPGDPIPPAPRAQPAPPGATLGADGFCLEGRGCFDWRGRRTAAPGPQAGEAAYERRGQYLSLALDSGIPGCRWHRVRVDAEVPEGTSVEIAFATTDGPPEGRPVVEPLPGEWSSFPAGSPHPTDWFVVTPGATDSTLGAAAGRYGYLRLRLIGAGQSTPTVHQVRLDLPRATGLDRLPAVYADDPAAADFTERFVSVFDAELEELDEVLARRPGLLDADGLPDDALAWLAGLVGTGFEAEMDVERRREWLRAAPELFRRRGTLVGLMDTLRVALGVTATVEELGTARPWGAVGSARLGGVRLFGRSRVRVRLGTSRLGRTRLESEGNPDHDAAVFGASRVRVHVPAGTDTALVARVVGHQLPAHVVAEISSAPAGFVATVLRLGVDTALTAPDPAVVGASALGRVGVVAGGRTAATGRVVGRPVARAAGWN